MPHRSRFDNWHRKMHDVDPVELSDRIMVTVQSAVDAALDTLLDVAERVNLSGDDLRGYAQQFRTRFDDARRAWRDDDDPEEALR